MEPTEFPSEEDRKELRSEGVYPLSPFIIRVGGFCGVWIGVLLSKGEWKNLVNATRDIWGKSENSPFEEVMYALSALIGSFAHIVGVTACAGLVGAALFGMLQTRGDFRLNRLSFVIGRINPFRNLRITRVLFRIVSAVVAYLVFPLCVWLLVREQLTIILSALTLDRAMFLRWPAEYLPHALVVVAFCVLLISAFVGVFTYVRFLFEHRVVRKDVV